LEGRKLCGNVQGVRAAEESQGYLRGRSDGSSGKRWAREGDELVL